MIYLATVCRFTAMHISICEFGTINKHTETFSFSSLDFQMGSKMEHNLKVSSFISQFQIVLLGFTASK